MAGNRAESATNPHPGPRVVVVGGAGAVGRLLIGAIDRHGAEQGSAAAVTVLDPGADDPESRIDVMVDAEALTGALTDADVVVLAVPESVAHAIGPVVLAATGSEAVVVDTLSVKDRWFRLVTGTSERPSVLAINPMFAPSLGFAGRPVAVVELPSPAGGDDRWSNWFMGVLAATGCGLVPVKANDHDRLTAGLQVATHAAVLAFGATMVELGLDMDQVGRLAPPPHLTMLALLARLVSGEPHVYHDIQYGHPLATETRAAMIAGLQRLEAAAAVTDPAAYRAFTEPMVSMVSGSPNSLTGLCHRLFAELRTPE